MSHAVFCSVLMGIDKVFLLVVVDVISIHAPLAGCDALLRPPGNRRAKRRFQSTPPLRGATLQHIEIQCNGQGISIHAPLAGCDYTEALGETVTYEFQSTHPLRGATAYPPRPWPNGRFQSTHPLRGATSLDISSAIPSGFQSTHPLRGATPRWKPATAPR